MADPIAIDGRVPIFRAKAPINGIDAPCSNVLVELRKIKSAYVNPGLYLSYISIITLKKKKKCGTVILNHCFGHCLRFYFWRSPLCIINWKILFNLYEISINL